MAVMYIKTPAGGPIYVFEDPAVIKRTLEVLENGYHEPEWLNGAADKVNRIWLRYPGSQQFEPILLFGSSPDYFTPDARVYLRNLCDHGDPKSGLRYSWRF